MSLDVLYLVLMGVTVPLCFCTRVSFVDDIAELEDELVESARADEARFRAFRCFFVIEAFSAQQKVSG